MRKSAIVGILACHECRKLISFFRTSRGLFFFSVYHSHIEIARISLKMKHFRLQCALSISLKRIKLKFIRHHVHVYARLSMHLF